MENIVSLFTQKGIYNIGAIIFIIIVPLLYFLDLFKLSVFTNFPRITIITTIILFFISLLNIIFKIEDKLNFSQSLFEKFLSEVSFYISLFLIFWISFTISNKLLYYTTLYSISMSFVMVILLLSIVIASQLSTFDFSNLERGTITDILRNIIFVIPCFLTELVGLMKSETSGLPSTTFILISITLVFIIIFYIVPYLITKMKTSVGVQLIQSPKPLDRVVLYLSQDQLNDKIIDSKPLATKQLLKQSNNFQNYLKDNPVEGFDGNIHILDKRLTFENDGYDSLEDYEKTIVKDAMKKDVSIDDFNIASEFKQYIKTLIKSGQDERYPYLLNMIKQYNDTKNDFIHQKSSKLVEMINRNNTIKEFNYHYALSFWVYFDPSLHKSRDGGSKGFILSYSDNPKIFYDYDKGTIVSTVRECVNDPLSKGVSNFNCTDRIIYESKDILFQKWNLFVINFNYGTLDIFVNNNLVSSTDGITPYIEKAFLQFGSSDDKLERCGICGVNYHDKPLTLNGISDIYRNNERPCFGDK